MNPGQVYESGPLENRKTYLSDGLERWAVFDDKTWPKALYSDEEYNDVTSLVLTLTQEQKDLILIDYSAILLEKQNYYISLVSQKTNELILRGFTFSGKKLSDNQIGELTFSLSENAQKSYLGLETAANFLTFPYSWNNIDDTDAIEFQTKEELLSFRDAAFAKVMMKREYGQARTRSIRKSSSVYNISMIVKNYLSL